MPATFWQRLAAGLIDFLVTALAVFSMGKFGSTSKLFASVIVVPLALFSPVYSTVGHALYGRTLGKYLLKIRVVRLDGTSVGWIEAVRRSSVDTFFSFVWLTGLMVAVSQLPAETFYGQGWSVLYKSLTPQLRPYVGTILNLSGYWTCSEFVTMLLNRNRRALHDFIGSTRVIRIENDLEPAADSASRA